MSTIQLKAPEKITPTLPNQVNSGNLLPDNTTPGPSSAVNSSLRQETKVDKTVQSDSSSDDVQSVTEYDLKNVNGSFELERMSLRDKVRMMKLVRKGVTVDKSSF